jgi:hypothetical protein
MLLKISSSGILRPVCHYGSGFKRAPDKQKVEDFEVKNMNPGASIDFILSLMKSADKIPGQILWKNKAELLVS